jgi:hypothetical protein
MLLVVRYWYTPITQSEGVSKLETTTTTTATGASEQ